MLTALVESLPAYLPQQTGVNSIASASILVAGPGTLCGVTTETFPSVGVGVPASATVSFYDAGALNECTGVAGGTAPDPLYTASANTTATGLNLAFAHGLCAVPSGNITASVAVHLIDAARVVA